MKRLFLLVLIPIVFLSSESGKNKKPEKKKAVTKTKVIASDAKRKGIRVVPEEEIGEWRSSRRVAIVVGVSGYPHESGLSALNFGASDSKKMALSLEQAGGFDRVVLLNDDTGKENPSLLPKRENILEQYENLLSEEPHLVLFYFSGHGFQNKGRNAITALDTVIARGASQASETEGAKKNAEIQEIAKNIIYIDDLIAKAQEKKITQTLFFLDACREKLREGAKAGAGEQFGKLPAEVESAKGVGVFMGTAPGGYSYETRELDGGVFTHYLIEGLMGGVQDENPGKAEYVTFGALKDYVEKKVKTYSKRKKNREQIPYTAGDYTGNFLITASRPKGKIRSEILSFKVDGKEKSELARVLFDTNDNPVQMQFFEEGEGEKYIPGDNKEGISKILYKITDKEYSASQFHIDGKPAGETYFSMLDKGWEVKRKEREDFERRVYDLSGNEVLKETYGKDEKLKGDYSGIARTVTKYDEKGNVILEETYGADGQPKGNSYGIVRYLWKYDQNCLKFTKRSNECIALRETYGADGQLIGFSNVVRKYDKKGKMILKESYEDGQLQFNYTSENYAIAREVWEYDDNGNKILEETYGKDGNKHFFNREIWKYDDKGEMIQQIQKETYGADGQLQAGLDGIARYVLKYDHKGNKIQQETYGADGQLKNRLVWKYDDKGNHIQGETYGADGQLQADENGIARYVWMYDENCLKSERRSYECQTLKETYGADGQLKADKDGIARYVRLYDENCLKSESKSYECETLKETYGADRRLKEKYGIARRLNKYDKNCLKAGKILDKCITLTDYYGADGKLKEDEYGFARYVYKYDEKGNRILKETYGVDERLKEKDGIARYVYKYDGKGNLILVETYGVDERLKEKDGIARYVYKYDGKGHRILEETCGADEKLKADGDGIARYVYKYDEKGNTILKETYGADGKLKEDEYGFARYVYKYDEKRYWILEETYGADEKLKGDKYGFARRVNKYDEKGNRILEETYGADGRLKEKDGIAKIISKYNTKGYKISSTYFSAAGSIVKKELSPVYYHPSIPDKVLQLNLDEVFRIKEVKLEDAKKQ